MMDRQSVKVRETMQKSKARTYAPYAISAVLHLVLLSYAHHVDTHPQKFGGLKYTDVDWRVVVDGAAYVSGRRDGSQAEGPLTRALGLKIGDPYNRATYRYTPLLSLVLGPALIHDLLGKLVLSAISLLVPVVLLSGPRPAGYWPTHLLWTLNPFVLNITTRGSPEATIVLLVVLSLYCLRKADHAKGDEQTKWEMLTAGCWALSISWKIYPVIYGVAIWRHLATRHGWFGRGIWTFGLVSLAVFTAVNGALWSIWGQPFLEHTFLYHLSRKDHRHNFSPYFYPIYLSFFPDSSSSALARSSPFVKDVHRLIQNPMASFVPQFGLVALAGYLLPPVAGMDMTAFVQTAIFVIFNKVCTSQYFVWFIPLLAPVISRLHLSRRKSIGLVSAWILAQALWLSTAYRLEFLGEAVHLGLWAAGLVLLVVSTWIIGQMLDAFDRDTKVEARKVHTEIRISPTARTFKID